MLPGIEMIKDGDQLLAIVIRAEFEPEKTVFVTPDAAYQQIGFVVYPAGGKIDAHDHILIERHLVGTPETLIIRKGHVKARLYNSKREWVSTVSLTTGDVIVLIDCGHGFDVVEDTVFFEIKQGPYTGLVEKERFE